MVDSAAPASGRVFISYRREETAYPAGWLYDRLADRYGGGQIFKDVDSIQLGDDFVEVITTAVGSCDVLLALVGDEWLTIADAHGRRRLDDPDDFVRLEIEAALTRNVRVIPILVDGASMPRADQLPASLAGLVRRQALELSPARFDFDTNRLLKVLDKTLAEVRTTQAGAVAPDTSGGPDGSVPDSVTLTVENPPRLAVGPATVDFGTVHGPSPQRIIRISNSGGGRLEARATTADSWLQLEQHDDQVLATVDTGTSGELMGAITVAAGEAGTIRIPVTARVEQPPGLVVEPAVGPTPRPGWLRRRGVLVTAAGVAAIAAIAIALVVRSETGGGGNQPETTSLPSQRQTTMAPDQLTWQRLPDLLVPVEAAGVAALRGEVWVVGGHRPDPNRSALDTVQIYNPVQEKWRLGPELDVPMDDAAVASDGERLFVIGGQTGPGTAKEASRDAYVLDGSDDSAWDAFTALPEPRANGAVAWDGSRLVFAGGYTVENDGRVAHADVWELNGDEWTPVEPGLTRARSDLAAATNGEGKVWFLGGEDIGDGLRPHPPLGAVDLVEGDSVKKLPEIEPAIEDSDAVWQRERGVCVFGGVIIPDGKNEEIVTDDVICSEPGPPPLPPLPSPRADTGAVLLNDNDTIYVVGGHGPDDSGRRVDALPVPKAPASSP
jgi:hypothetical protein